MRADVAKQHGSAWENEPAGAEAHAQSGRRHFIERVVLPADAEIGEGRETTERRRRRDSGCRRERRGETDRRSVRLRQLRQRGRCSDQRKNQSENGTSHTISLQRFAAPGIVTTTMRARREL